MKDLIFLKQTRFWMNTIGIWPFQPKNKLSTKIRACLRLFLQVTVVMFFTQYFISLKNFGDIDFNMYIPFFLFFIMFIFKMLLCRSQPINDLLKTIISREAEMFAKESETVKKIYYDYIKYSIYVVFYLALSGFATGIFLDLFCADTYQDILALNDSEPVRLNVQQWFPFDVKTNFQYVFFYQLILTTVIAYISFVGDTLFLYLIIYPAMRLRILRHKFQQFSSQRHDNPDLVVRNLFVEHQEIIRYVLTCFFGDRFTTKHNKIFCSMC